MKSGIHILFAFLFLVIQACREKTNDFDEQGRLKMTALKSQTGDFSFEPMQHTDSADVKNHIPAVYTYNGEAYTGKIAAYNEQGILMIEGALDLGKQDGNWKFYYPSGIIMIQGNYENGIETGTWTSYYSSDKPKIKMNFDKSGYMLMRTEFYDTGKVKNYQNVRCPEYGNRERRIQFTYDGKIEYIDAEREIGLLPPQDINLMIKSDALFVGSN